MFSLRCLQTCTSYDYRIEVCKHSIQHFSYSHIITVINQKKNSNLKKKRFLINANVFVIIN